MVIVALMGTMRAWFLRGVYLRTAEPILPLYLRDFYFIVTVTRIILLQMLAGYRPQ